MSIFYVELLDGSEYKLDVELPSHTNFSNCSITRHVLANSVSVIEAETNKIFKDKCDNISHLIDWLGFVEYKLQYIVESISIEELDRKVAEVRINYKDLLWHLKNGD